MRHAVLSVVVAALLSTSMVLAKDRDEQAPAEAGDHSASELNSNRPAPAKVYPAAPGDAPRAADAASSDQENEQGVIPEEELPLGDETPDPQTPDSQTPDSQTPDSQTPGGGDAPLMQRKWLMSDLEQPQWLPARVHVFCPPDAKVWINERETTSHGAYRLFHVSGVDPFSRRTLPIRVESCSPFATIVDAHRSMRLRSGDDVTIRFEWKPVLLDVAHTTTAGGDELAGATSTEVQPEAAAADDRVEALKEEVAQLQETVQGLHKLIEELNDKLAAQVRKLDAKLSKTARAAFTGQSPHSNN